MALTPGTTLGPYEILSPIGAGGMGEVYKARDTRLDRTVAIKVLPEHVASDPDLKQRFERGASILAWRSRVRTYTRGGNPLVEGAEGLSRGLRLWVG